MIPLVPKRFEDIDLLMRNTGISKEEAQRRFAQFMIIDAIVSVPTLRSQLVFKGGNALDFIWHPNRSTLDLDFSIDAKIDTVDLDLESIRRLTEAGISRSIARHGGNLLVHSIRQRPPGELRSFRSYMLSIGYAMQDQQSLMRRMSNGQTSPHVIPVDITTNEPLGRAVDVPIEGMSMPVRACAPEDIVAEKLRALLQQPVRNRRRPQDVLDIAVLIQGKHDLDRVEIADFLLRKAAARDIAATRASFHNPEIRDRASVDYDSLATTARTTFIPFDEAFANVLDLVNALDIPDE